MPGNYDMKKIVIFMSAALMALQLSASVWHIHYERAQKAIEKNRWQEAASELQEAIRDREEPGIEVKTVGMRFIDYLPYYLLGKCRFELGQFKEADEALIRSENLGIIKKRPVKYKELQEMREACRIRISPPETDSRDSQPLPPADSPATIIARGDRLFEAGDWQEARREYISAKTRITRTGEMQEKLSTLNRRINEIDRLLRVNNLILNAESALDRTDWEKARLILAELRAVDPGNNRLPALEQRLPDPAPSQATESKEKSREEAIRELLSDGKRRAAEGKLAESQAKFRAILQLDPGHPQSRKWLKQIEQAQAVGNVNEAIRLYFLGERAKSEETLRKAASHLSPASDAAFTRDLFLAVILFEKSFLGLDPGGKAWKEANQLAIRIRRLRPDFTPTSNFFSPRVIECFRKAEN